MTIVGDASGLCVEPVQALAKRARPNLVLAIRVDGHKQIIREAIGILGVMTKVYKTACIRVEAFQAGAPGGDPDISAAVFRERADGICPQTGRVTWVITIQAELSGGGRQFIDAIVGRANPQTS